MPHRLTSLTKKERAAVLRVRLHAAKLVRELGYEVDTSDVWNVVALGRYEGFSVNITKIIEMTGLKKDAVRHHLDVLIAKGDVIEKQSGNQRLQILPDSVLFQAHVVRYYAERGSVILDAAAILETRLERARGN